MKNIKVVIGSNYGDEGKGLMTDYFSHNIKASLVIRHSGGPQSGHTVITPEGNRHIFSHIGAGTFAKRSTFLSEYFLVNPIMFLNEHDKFKLKNPDIRLTEIFISENCFITTPFDMIINQALEVTRNSNKHGSCGAGINETMIRNKNNKYKLTIKQFLDMSEAKRFQFFDNILFKEYFKIRIIQTNIDIKLLKEKYNIINYAHIIKNFMEIFQEFLSKVIVIKTENELDLLNSYKGLIFEGSQGLSLDMSHKNFPYVTHANTGIKNVLSILNKNNLADNNIEICYGTRSYTTKHGAGPFTHELKLKPYNNIEDLTNIPNDFQDELRYSYLNLDEIYYNIQNDFKLSNDLKNVKLSLWVSCLDQLDNNLLIMWHDNKKIMKSIENGIQYIINNIKLSVHNYYKFYGPTRNDIIEYNMPIQPIKSVIAA